MMTDAFTATGYFSAFSRLLDRVEITAAGQLLSTDQGVASISESIVLLSVKGSKALLVGNGGSAAIVSHMHNDLCKTVGVRALLFYDTPLLTAVANDHGYQTAFERGVELWGDRNDLLIAVSSSGESENILTAATRAKEKGCRLITFTGFRPTNRLRCLGDQNVYVPAAEYGYVETAHSLIAHCITDMAMARVRVAAT